MPTIETQDLSLFESYLKGLVPSLVSFALSVIGAVLVYVIGVRVIRWIRRLFGKMLKRHNVDEGVCQFLDAIVKVAGYFILVLMILGFFGVTTASVVAVLGSAGLTLDLALQGSLSNFAGGVLILLLKPFVVGDYIIEESGKKEGTVQEISIFYTTLLTADFHTVVVPNGTLANNSITNLTKSGKRRLDIKVGISYSSDIKQAKQVLFQVAQQSDYRLLSEAPVILVDELADSSVNLIVRVWTDPDAYWNERWELTEQIKLALDDAGIEIAFPQLDVHVR